MNAGQTWEHRPSTPHGEVLGHLREEEEPAETQTRHSAFFQSRHYDAEDKQYSQRWERPYSSTIGMNFGLSTAESCSFVLAASFAKDCE